MASPPLITLLRLLPLLSSTASMTHAYMELITLTSFYHAPPPKDSLVTKLLLSQTEPGPSTSLHATSLLTSTPTAAVSRGEAGREQVRQDLDLDLDLDDEETESETEKAKDIVLPIWFTTWFNKAVYSVVLLNNLTLFSAVANAFLFPPTSAAAAAAAAAGSSALGSRTWYLLGAGAALGHFAFVPAVETSIVALFRMRVEREREREKGRGGGSGSGSGSGDVGRAARLAREWIGVHRLRMATVDLAAWVCFGVAAVGSLSRGVGGIHGPYIINISQKAQRLAPKHTTNSDKKKKKKKKKKKMMKI
ncbi:hypothetical protein K504DRAFT_495799 [Pleomassaria siparia CBS 279.74]|uniref:Uncharacterized protein n=1 Tax=Pleomassaria siparia CBS 279.74 TaxID=1314801 RepID=A0A6G1JR82_9PLEO|nr:hypothetical protein K504DRAFT_495799 [Pleomassaria siparia CBS 279.74]